MKRYGNLMPEIMSRENLAEAHRQARRGKGWQDAVAYADTHLDKLIPRLQADLALGTYATSRYSTRRLVDRGKERVIYRLPYWPDRVVQHAVCQVLIPIWRASMIRSTYASIPGRGLRDCAKRVRRELREDPDGTRYCLKMDIRHFYPNINHEVMKRLVAQRVKDPQVLALVGEIIDSVDTSDPHVEGVGLPIGNYLSQWLANLYLTPADWRFKQHYRMHHYHRYMDDMVVLGPDKDRLHEIRKDFTTWIAREFGLTVKGDWQVFPVDVRGVDFVGYRFFHDRTMLRTAMKKRMRRSLSPTRARTTPGRYWRAVGAAPSYNGWTKFGNTRTLNRTYVDPWMREIKEMARHAH